MQLPTLEQFKAQTKENYESGKYKNLSEAREDLAKMLGYKNYRAIRPVLVNDSIPCHILKGQKLAVIGMSGSGKTWFVMSLHKCIDKKTTVIFDYRTSTYSLGVNVEFDPQRSSEEFKNLYGFDYPTFKEASIKVFTDVVSISELDNFKTLVVDEVFFAIKENPLLIEAIRKFAKDKNKTLIVLAQSKQDIQELEIDTELAIDLTPEKASKNDYDNVGLGLLIFKSKDIKTTDRLKKNVISFCNRNK